ncbi:EAL domain-containing protein [Catellatospora coxensis]|uniref:EAL domain-containing protein n=1 Tax=Catellatospora coxensis TaxID=310354 RepID=A0A8J3KV83_9ACTN|nr:EAL domain-containing protein [Catellatospora coxensis]GIG03801.1 hypothetical protein Cco03nite_05010 [Catellatospora coxensis]
MFESILSDRLVYCVYQPIVTLSNGQTVAYEALARGPESTEFHSPAALFAYAVRAGCVPELDRLCQAAACQGALRAGLPLSLPLFMNVDQVTLGMPAPAGFVDDVKSAMARLQIVFELTEHHPPDIGALMTSIDWIRRRGGRIALDDVGAAAQTLTLMPLVSPDVIKLDRHVVQSAGRHAAVVDTVRAQARRTDAAILAEGIETRHHLKTAIAIGASLGQGWLFGPPAPLPTSFTASTYMLPRITWATHMSEIRGSLIADHPSVRHAAPQPDGTWARPDTSPLTGQDPQ